MTDKYYDVYFDAGDLIVDERGRFENPEVLQIIEFEYDDATGSTSSSSRPAPHIRSR